MKAISFISFGHSHNVALAMGFYAMEKRKETTFEGVSFSGSFHSLYNPPFAPILDEAGALRQAVVEFIQRAKRQCILLSLSGNEHNILSIVQQKKPFDFMLTDGETAPDPQAELLTLSAVRETVREWMDFNHVGEIARAFSASALAPIFLIEPPPPLPAEQVRAHPEIFQKALSKAKISSDSLRHKIWGLQGALYREICREHGFRYVPVPARLIDKNGLLIKAGCGADATHANAVFGREMMLEIFACVRKLVGETSDAA